MTDKQIATVRDGAGVLEQVIVGGDLSQLSPTERVGYYKAVCESLGLNPLTKPFEYIKLNGNLTLYARRDATDQLRALHGISTRIVSRERLDDLYIVTAHAETKDGRCDESIGVVALKGLAGDALANGFMKAETKAKRRVTLSIVGLGLSDETEIETIPQAQTVTVDAQTGEIVEPKATPQPEPVKNGNGHGKRPASPEVVRGWIHARAQQLAVQGATITDGERGAMVGAVEALFPYAADKAKREQLRHELTRFFFGHESSKDLSASQVLAVLRWAQDRLDTGEYIPSEDAMAEATAILRQEEAAKGDAEPQPEPF